MPQLSDDYSPNTKEFNATIRYAQNERQQDAIHMMVLAAQLAAAVALLWWSVRLIRTGVERAFMAELKRGL